MKHYHFEPFNPQLGERQATKEGAAQIASQMMQAINQAAQHGWTFESYESVQTTVNPGCLNVFAGPRLVHYGVLVFSRDDSPATSA